MYAMDNTGEKLLRLMDVLRKLREPGGCPWDREQTMQSLRPCIIEEAYELIEAIDSGDGNIIAEECGDNLLQVAFIARIAEEEGIFDLGSVLDILVEKLIRRHPHVFGDVSVADSEGVKKNWEQIKREERRAKDRDHSILSGVPKSLPALVRAFQIQERAAKVGFDWPAGDVSPLLEKIDEELEELAEARKSEDMERIREEVGDLLFAAVNLARHLGVDAEFSLQETNKKFTRRFGYIEKTVEGGSRDWSEYSLDELENLWQRAKTRT
jgi:XTP/dITP diphosphohydrolase/tetrapyrrole methylase family protein/MazG family protein/ATP diphosphatase